MYNKLYYHLFFNKDMTRIRFSNVFFSFIFFLYFEFFFVFTTYTSYKSKNFFFFYPNKITVLIIFCFMYFIYVWGFSNWRRTQYGKFTRGDRKLWAKSYASFWIVEFTTILSIFFVACWMNWGPTIFIPRRFCAARKGFIIELTIFTYVMWILYLIRFTLKWNKWQTQYFLICLILVLIFYLIWRDLCLIVGRENISLRSGSRWKYVTVQTICYTFSPKWWFQHFINQHEKLDHNSYFFSLKFFLDSLNDLKFENIFTKNNSLNLYEKLHFLPYTNLSDWKSLTFFDLNSVSEVTTIEPLYFSIFKKSTTNLTNYKYYPRRIGSHYKRIAIWTILLFLKLWHHIMLLVWWFFYLMKLTSRRKNSYSYLSICYFNLYCCFLISLLVYLFNYLTFYEKFFKIIKHKPIMRTFNRTRSHMVEAFFDNFLLFYLFFNQLLKLKFIKSYEMNGYKRIFSSVEPIISSLGKESSHLHNNYYIIEVEAASIDFTRHFYSFRQFFGIFCHETRFSDCIKFFYIWGPITY